MHEFANTLADAGKAFLEGYEPKDSVAPSRRSSAGMEVYVAIQTGDTGEELLGVFASMDGAVGAMKSRSYRGSEATNVEPFRTWSGRDGWYLTNPHQIDQPLARQWVGVVHRAKVEGIGQLFEPAAESAS